MYESDPIRDPNLLGCTVKPWCGEPRIELLTRDYYTPNELFYVRNHLAVPDIDEGDYCLIVKGKGITKHKFTLKDLKEKFPKHEVVTTLQCAGNRREDMHDDNHKVFCGFVFRASLYNSKNSYASLKPRWVIQDLHSSSLGCGCHELCQMGRSQDP
jgi:Oxidoreductase molybdopterin binding domain